MVADRVHKGLRTRRVGLGAADGLNAASMLFDVAADGLAEPPPFLAK